MTFNEIAASAKRGEQMPELFGISEQLAYQAVNLLTARYRAGAVTAEQAQAEMQQIRNQFASDQSREKYIYTVAKLWLDIECAAIKFNKEPTIENATLMRDVIYGFRRLSDKDQEEAMALEC